METARLIAYAEADGPTNMAADETLADAAAVGLTSLRFYGWSPATASLGYFQPASVLQGDPLLAKLPFVRRPSGGATLVHHHELAYALALPATIAGRDIAAWIRRMHALIRDALNALLGQPLVELATEERILGKVLCFQKQTVGDLVLAGHKIVGSAQRKHHGSLVQHGSILLRQSEFVPVLPGILELAGQLLPREAIEAELKKRWPKTVGMTLNEGDWSGDESRQIERTASEKYATHAWNEKR